MEFSEDNKPWDTQQTPAEEEVNWKRFIVDILETLILAVVLFVGINTVSARVRVEGTSMRPTLEDGEFVLVNRLSYRFGEMMRGDIIVFHFPINPKEDLIKRIIGLPGDTVQIQNGEVSLNGIILNEPYIAAAPNYNGTWQVEENMIFVLGDNRNNSSDSHEWGLLPIEKVVGKAVLIYWPIPFWQVIQHTEILQ